MNIIDLRNSKNLTQNQAALIIGMSRRGYQELEYKLNENSRSYKQAFNALFEYNKIDENHGILTIDEIKKQSSDVFNKYNIDYAILFGSYSRDEAKETSDIDILVSTNLKGLAFMGLNEELRNTLNKKVDLIRSDTLKASDELVQDILKEGIRIYKN